MISRSESPADLIKELRADGFRVYAEGDKLHVTPTNKRLPDLPEPFTAKEVYRNHWRGLDMDGTKQAIGVLLDYGHLRVQELPEEDPDQRPRGRPTIRYEVHPAIRGGRP